MATKTKEMSFDAKDTPEVSKEVQDTQSNTPAVMETTMGTVGKVQGEKSRRDIILPTLKIAQSVGPLADNFSLGNIVLNNEYLLSEGDEPVTLTVLTQVLSYIENVEYGGDKLPRRFKTEEEVRAAGLHLEWIDNQRPPAQKMAEALVVVESKEEHPLFPFVFSEEGKPDVYVALAVWTMRGMSYDRAARLITTAGDFALRDGLHTGSWELTTKREKANRNTVAVPVLRHGSKNSIEKQQFLLSLV